MASPLEMYSKICPIKLDLVGHIHTKMGRKITCDRPLFLTLNFCHIPYSGKLWRMLTFQIFDGKHFDGWSVSFTKHCIPLKNWRVKFWRSGWKASKTSKFPPVKISCYMVREFVGCLQGCPCRHNTSKATNWLELQVWLLVTHYHNWE